MRIARAAITAAAIAAAAATATVAGRAARTHRAGPGTGDGQVVPVPDAPELLACPRCHGPLDWAGGAPEWRCPA
ncbi:MAG: hypothetical protein WCF36_14335 [Candidatus Nanopelagicales bacterium]|jgi:uncharacterized protein YraI